VSNPACSQYLRVNAAAIITDQEAKITCAVLQLDVNTIRPRMPERVSQSLPANAVNLVAKQGIER